ALLTWLGRIQRERLGQLEDAAVSFRAALAIDADALGALDDLIKIVRQRGDQPALADALLRRGRTVTDLAEKRAAFAEVAQRGERAGDVAGAMAAWREIIEADDGDRGALDELARIQRAIMRVSRTADLAGDQVGELIETLTRAAQLAGSAADE